MNQARVIRLLMLGLPVGLIITTTIALVMYFRGEADAAGRGYGPHTRRDITRKDLQAHVEMLAKTIGPRHMGDPDRLVAAGKYIEGTLGPANLGYKVSRHTYQVNGTDCHNLVLNLLAEGSDRIAEVVLIGAHYDTVPGTPGADDNASGVAALMSLAQAFANTKHQRSLRFVFFTNEEPPHFQTKDMGSLVYAKECKKRGDNIVAMLSLESIGYYSAKKGSQKTPPGLDAPVPDRGDFLAVIGNVTSQPIVDVCRNWFGSHSTLPVLGMALPATVVEQGWSDHWSFWQQGYPAVMVTDTAVLRNPHYHQPTDTSGTLDYERLVQAVKGLEGVIQTLANPGRVQSAK